ncbi:hypothetical protein [Microbacterium sp. No. 7]|uniref:hypothetical protein n=1 Tax=Microbacterium sp. No. 7 TaxID=1714373 RepID=UPI0006D03977|nr:hypothetical protein [Microbacterium sp. No. 7]ALJ20311.1 hypothetical protein AOA12_10465 [Microbacterium sp. No. 7]
MSASNFGWIANRLARDVTLASAEDDLRTAAGAYGLAHLDAPAPSPELFDDLAKAALQYAAARLDDLLQAHD